MLTSKEPVSYQRRLRRDFDRRIARALTSGVWSSDTLLDALCLQCAVRQLQSDEVSVVDPTLLALVCRGDCYPAFQDNAHALRQQLRRAPLALVPLSHGPVLLAYFHAWGLWISLDSSQPVDGGSRRYVLQTLYRLQQLRVVRDTHQQELELRAAQEGALGVVLAASCVLEARRSTAQETSSALDTMLQHCGSLAQFASVLQQQCVELTGEAL